MNSNLELVKGAENFRSWLLERNFKIQLNPCSDRYNECNWVAYKISELPARPCESNTGILIRLLPYKYNESSPEINCEIEFRAEVNGIWIQIKAFGINVNDLMSTEGKLEEIESNLIAAWNAIKPESVE